MNNHNEREHALLSASSAHRWLACPPSAVAAEAYPDQDTEFTREGTLAHEVAETIATGASDELLDQMRDENSGIDAEMLDCAHGYRDYIQELTTTPDAIVLLEQKVDYSPWAPDGFGTCDCIIIQDRLLTIIDYKYGQGVAVSAEDNPQMKLYALGALNDFGIAYDVTRVEMHIYQPRLNNISSCSLMVEDLLEWGESIKPIAAKAAKGKGNYRAGAWCKFCPHAGRCRKLTQTCTEYVETHSLRAAVPVLAPHEVAEVLNMKPLVELWLKRVEGQALNTLLDGGEVPGYKVVEGKLGNRKWFNENEVCSILEGNGYFLEDITETKLLSPAAMDKAIGKKKVAELLGGYIDRAPGKPTIVPASDSRPNYDRTNDFEKLD